MNFIPWINFEMLNVVWGFYAKIFELVKSFRKEGISTKKSEMGLKRGGYDEVWNVNINTQSVIKYLFGGYNSVRLEY